MITALTLSGSIRTGSFNRLLQHDMSERLRNRGVDVTELDLGDYPLPIFNEDIEAAGMPEAAEKLGALFIKADIVFIASPEYNGAIAPLTANTLAWVSRQKGRPFRHAVFGIGGVSSGNLSTAVALTHLRDMLTKMMALVAPVDIRVGSAAEAFDADGRLIDETVIARADLLAEEMVRLAAK